MSEELNKFHNLEEAAGMMDWEQLQQQIRQLENEFMKYQDVQGNSSIPKAVHKMVLIENIMSRRERGLI